MSCGSIGEDTLTSIAIVAIGGFIFLPYIILIILAVKKALWGQQKQ